LWELAVELDNQINDIPSLMNNTTQAISLYSNVSAFNATVFIILSQLTSLSMQANTIIRNLTEIVVINIDSYANETNESLELLQNTNAAQASATNIERIPGAHQGILNNMTTQLQELSMAVSGLDVQVQQLDMGVDDLQELAINIRQLRMTTMSLVISVNGSYDRANNALQSARQEFTTAVNIEQNITSPQLQVSYPYTSITANLVCYGLCRSSHKG